MRKRNRGTNKAKRRVEVQEQARVEDIRAGALGPPDPMPDGSQRKARLDALSRLKQLGQISPDMERALFEILDVFKARTSLLFARSQSFERVDRSSCHGELEWLLTAGKRYNEWAALMKGREINAHELIMDVFLDGWTLKECDRRIGRRKGTAKVEIQKALIAYCIAAGWMRRVA